MGDLQQRDNGGEEGNAEKYASPFESSTFNVFDACFVLISMGLLVADLVTGELK